eukprot:COSAG02_NODE_1051_length_14956_cov_3.414216_6_plen_104_part_00
MLRVGTSHWEIAPPIWLGQFSRGRLGGADRELWLVSGDQSFVTELCVLRTFGGVDFSLISICAQSVPEFLWDRLPASIQFPVMPKRAQYARFSGEHEDGRSVQ